MIAAIVLFVLTYVLMLMLPKYRPYVALGSALIFLVTGMLPVDKILSYLDFNVLMMIAGTMGIVALFIESQMPALLADLILERVPNVKWAMIALALFAGVISAFVDNVATVLMVAPVALAISKRLDSNPVPMLIAIAVSSNLQGAATLVGDTTAIMLGSYADMNFLDFFVYEGRPSMFFAVELGALMMVASTMVPPFIMCPVFTITRLIASKNSLFNPFASRRWRNLHKVVSSGTASAMKSMPVNFRMA